MSGGVWIIGTAFLLAVVCSWVGSLLLLRRMVLLGDVISHAVLPGIVVAFLWSGVRDLPLMLAGALGSALLAVATLHVLQHWFGWQSETGLAAVLSGFFAVGLLLLSLFGGSVDLDLECVLYGEIAYVPLQMVPLAGGGVVLPRALLVAAAVLLVVALVGVVAYKELVVSAFDPAFAATVGLAPRLWQAVLLSMTATVTVVGFELVGVILIVALLVLPAATARLLSTRLSQMFLIAMLCGMSSAVGGYVLATVMHGAIAGWMALTAGTQYALALGWKRLRARLQQLPPSAEEPFGAQAQQR